MLTQDLGPVEHFLGVDIQVKKVYVELKQSKGIESILSTSRMEN